MDKSNPKNYDVILAFVVFIFCIFIALFYNAGYVSAIVGIN